MPFSSRPQLEDESIRGDGSERSKDTQAPLTVLLSAARAAIVTNRGVRSSGNIALGGFTLPRDADFPLTFGQRYKLRAGEPCAPCIAVIVAEEVIVRGRPCAARIEARRALRDGFARAQLSSSKRADFRSTTTV